METIEAITTRRSIRKYNEDRVPDEIVRELLTAAMSGPSAGNQQPWQFVAVTDRERLDALAEIRPYRAMLSTAPLVVIICGDMQRSKLGEYWVVDCSIATQNLLLAAHARGLGAVWLGCHYMAERADPVREKLGLPPHIMPFAVVSIGYPAQQLPAVERYQAERVHADQW